MALAQPRGDESHGRRRVGPGDRRRSAPPPRRQGVRGGAGSGAQHLGPAAVDRHASAARPGGIPCAVAPRGSGSGSDRAGAARTAGAAGRSLRGSTRAAWRRCRRGGAHRRAVSGRSRAAGAARQATARASRRELRPLGAPVAQPAGGRGRVHPTAPDPDPRPPDGGRAQAGA